jgi:hypothetical protein
MRSASSGGGSVRYHNALVTRLATTDRHYIKNVPENTATAHLNRLKQHAKTMQNRMRAL